MSERLSYQLTDILGNYLVEAMAIDKQIGRNLFESLDKSQGSLLLVELKRQEILQKVQDKISYR